MSDIIQVDSGRTLSIHSSPGEDTRRPSLSTESIFSFGNFRLQRDLTPNVLSGQSTQLSFSNFGTINSLSNEETFDSTAVVNITTNDLNPKKDEANSYTYFGSFYTKVATSINNIVEKFPYGILSYDNGTGVTLHNYVNFLTGGSIFNIAVSGLTNQGNIIYASGYTASTSMYTLFNDYTDFVIEMSSSTRYSQTFPILNYSYTASTGLMTFKIDGQIFSADTSATTVGVYILPSDQRYYSFKKTLSNLEYQLLFEQKFMVPNPDDDTFENRSFPWPKTLDGFNPDSYGSAFESYYSTLLRSCSLIDEIKTNWMVRTMIPENYIELDSEGGIYRKIITVYAEEFDKIKQYIDGIAFAHSVTYSNEEAIPNKFLHRLSKLLGWEPINEFNDVDIFEYLGKEDDDGLTVSDYNFELWKKILININWLYKKKGTREALEFIFKLMGAPDCLINFNELVYKIQQASTGTTTNSLISAKVNNETGYPNYEAGSVYAFQENGAGRGDGDEYIKQWEPEFNPIREVDNRKVHTGDTSVYGTANVINSKQVNIELSPATAIECDVNDWYNLGFVSGGTAVGVPTWVDVNGVAVHIPSSISGMSMGNWMDYVYRNAIDPRNRKTAGYKEGQHTYFYRSLRDIYIAYYYWNNPNSASSRVNFRKLESFLALVERNFGAYIQKLIPATTIIESDGVQYRNTTFNRQKFVYPPGINDGSEFKLLAPVSPDLEINAAYVTATINDFVNPQINGVTATVIVNKNYDKEIAGVEVTNDFNTSINPVISAVVIKSVIENVTANSNPVGPRFVGAIAPFPKGGVPQAQPPAVGRPFQTKTSSDVEQAQQQEQAND